MWSNWIYKKSLSEEVMHKRIILLLYETNIVASGFWDIGNHISDSIVKGELTALQCSSKLITFLSKSTVMRDIIFNSIDVFLSSDLDH